MTKETRDVFCFDTSAFVTLSRTDERVIEVPARLWERLAELMEEGAIVSHQLVYEEISSKSKNPDFIARWIVGKENSFIGRTQAQEEIVPDIVRKFPHLIDYEREKEQADPWIVALAIEKSRDESLFTKTEAYVVSQENPMSSKKIPAVCTHFKVKHLSLRELFDKMGIGTTLARRT